MKRLSAGLAAFALLSWSVGCATMDNSEQGAIIGAAGGAVVGGLIGHDAGDTLLGAIIGAAIGGAAGAYIGRYMDQQAAEMRQDVEGASVDRIGEGIRIWFDVGLLFDVDGFELRVAGRQALLQMAFILNRYPETYVIVEGNADDWGPREHAIGLSERRARAVGEYLERHDVNPGRFTFRRYDPDRPSAPGDRYAAAGHGRRMDVAVVASDRLKRTARER